MGKRKYRMCLRKRKYTVREANRVSGKLRENFEIETHKYLCPFCGKYHIGRDQQIENIAESRQEIEQNYGR